MEDSTEFYCDLCKVAYSSDSELKDHRWSLMHHIKMEQKNKGSAHSCALCLTICDNIITYGKHLNNDKHKQALQRRNQGGKDDILDSFADVDAYGHSSLDTATMDIDPTPPDVRSRDRQSHDHQFLPPDAVGTRRQKRLPLNRQIKGQKHMRSYSEPEIDRVGRHDRNGSPWFQGESEGYIPDLMQMTFESFHDDMVPWQPPGQGHPDWGNRPRRSRWDQPPDPNLTANEWFNNFHSDQQLYKPFLSYENRNQNADNFNSSRTDINDTRPVSRYSVEDNHGRHGHPSREQPGHADNLDIPNYVSNEFDGDGSHFKGGQSWRPDRLGEGRGKRRGSFDSNFDVPDPEDTGYRAADRRSMGILRHSRGMHASRSEQDTTKDHLSPDSNSSTESIPMKRRGDDLHFSSGKSWRDNKSNRIQAGPSSRGRMTESAHILLNDESNQRQNRPRSRSRSADMLVESASGRVEGRRTASPSPSRSSSRQSKQVTWASDAHVSSTTDQMDSDTSHSRKKKNVAIRSSSADARKKKQKNKNQRHESPHSYSPRGRPKKVPDKGESVLEKAELLCKKLRQERERGKKEKERLEREKKLEKQRDLSEQIEALSEKNKINIKGHLEAVEKVLDTQLMQSNNLNTTVGGLNKSLSASDSSALSNKSHISKIREDIERSVKSKELKSDEKSAKSITTTQTLVSSPVKKMLTKPDTTTPRLNSGTSNFQSPLSKHQHSKAKSDTLQKDALVKMVNSPRSTKERLHLAQMLRTYAKSRTKLSLPRFNLKMSDICSGSEKPDDPADFNLDEMSPDMQLEIAHLIEMDVKPDVSELEQMLNLFSSENAVLDSEILSTLGVNSPNKPPLSDSPLNVASPLVKTTPRQRSFSENQENVSALRNTSPIPSRKALEMTYDDRTSSLPLRSSSPVVVKRERSGMDDADNRPSLSIEDLVSEVSKAQEHLMGIQEEIHRERSVSPIRRNWDNMNPNTMEREVSPARMQRSVEMNPRETAEGSIILPCVTIKQEKNDNSYELAALSGSTGNVMYDKSAQSVDINSQSGTSLHHKNYCNTERNYENMSQFHGTDNSMSAIGRQSPVRQNLFNLDSDIPERDIDLPASSSPRVKTTGDMWSALDKVNAILDGAPTVEKVLQAEKGPDIQVAPPALAYKGQTTPPVLQPQGQSVIPAMDNRDKDLDVSQTSSVLEQVYSISLQEEGVRHNITTMDQRIGQLRRLIDEASQELSKYTEKKGQLQQQEGEMRSRRIKLLEESRSLQGSTSSQNPASSPSMPLQQLPDMTDKHPMLVKFLMSQKQPSDLSSISGYSNVESGSQAEPEMVGGSRRGSLTSNISEPVCVPGDQLQPTNVTTSDDRKFFTKSIDILSGSFSSEKSHPPKETASSVSVEKSGDMNTPEQKSSLSLLNTPLEKKGFITLDSLLKGEGDMGKLLRSSLEKVGDNTASHGGGNETPSRITTNESNDKSVRAEPISADRRGSALSISSDDLLSGSDAGKVSLKYMGILPEGLSYDTLMKQISVDSRHKSVSYSVLSSPEVLTQLKKISDSGIGTSSLSSRVTQDSHSKPVTVPGFVSDDSIRTKTTDTVTATDFESQSVRSNYSLGEEIKRRCVGQNVNPDKAILWTGSDSDEKTPTAEDFDVANSVKFVGTKNCTVQVNRLENEINTPEKFKLDGTEISNQKSIAVELAEAAATSPMRKKLKSKKERDRKSRRKQKETFILETSSDANSFEEESHSKTTHSSTSSVKSVSNQSANNEGSGKQLADDDGMVVTGSEDQQTPRPMDKAFIKGSLLAEVQLETLSDSSLDPEKVKARTSEDLNRLRVKPEMLLSFRSAVKTKLPQGKTTPTVQYKGPSLSVAAIQIFKDEVYVCYNGSEIRRFCLKTGEVLKELDCSPYLVNCLHVTSVADREDILYTGGACKKLMLFKPQKFKLIETYDYDDRLQCLHEGWGRIFVGLADGVVSVRSLKNDKELNSFQCTNKSVLCLSSTSAGMTKLLCCGTADKIVYILDAMTGLLLTMLQGHSLPPLCIQVCDELVVSGAADKTMLVHNITSGDLVQTVSSHKAPISSICCDDECVYTASHDRLIRCYSKKNFKLQQVYYGAGKGILTFLVKAGKVLLSGNRDGQVEAIPLWTTASSWLCQCENCSLDFPIREHLLHHIVSDHLLANTRMVPCPWSGCSEWLSTEKDSMLAEEHILTTHCK